MAYLCFECYETYKTPFQNCPKTSCNGYVAEVDDLMLPIIMLLNKKGYCTEYCCSGHTYDGSCYPYIAFSTFLNELLNKKEFNELFKDLPKPWYIDDDTYDMRVLRCKIENGNIIELQKSICDANLKLLDFVNTLPTLYCDEEEVDDNEIKVGVIYE